VSGIYQMDSLSETMGQGLAWHGFQRSHPKVEPRPNRFGERVRAVQ
jgi:hypothetical protein